jgi:hypothetical protein
MDHVLPWGESPVDLDCDSPVDLDCVSPEQPPRGGVGWAAGAVAASSLMLLAFNSHALANWADQLPVVPLTMPIVVAADVWHARAEQLGLNAVVDRVEQAAAAMRDARWPSPPGRTRSDDQR